MMTWILALRRAPAAGCLCVLLAAAGAPAASAQGNAPQAGDVAERVEKLVRQQYFEGLPFGEASALGPAAVGHLIRMLDDPAEAEHHSNIVEALGLSGSPLAFPALAKLDREAPAGELTRLQYRVRMALPIAIGHLARSDRRALTWLIERARDDSATPYRYRHIDGERMGRILQRAAISGLGVSGDPEATRALLDLYDRTPRGAARSDALRAHIEASHALCERVDREGAAAVFGGTPGSNR